MRGNPMKESSPTPLAEKPSPLSELGTDDLKKVLSDRLHDRQSLGPPIDARGDFPSYLWLVDEYRQGSDRFQKRMEYVTDSLVQDLVHTQRWPGKWRDNLFNFIQECGMTLRAVNDMLRRKTLLSISTAGREAHAGLLKCLLRSNQKQDPSFWLRQLLLLGDNYGALVFRALSEHGLYLAAKYLPDCSRSRVAVNGICLFLPTLVNNHTLERVQNAIRINRGLLPEDVYQEFWEILNLIGGGKSLSNLPALSQEQVLVEAAMWGALLDSPRRLLSDEATLRALEKMGVSEDKVLQWVQDREPQ